MSDNETISPDNPDNKQGSPFLAGDTVVSHLGFGALQVTALGTTSTGAQRKYATGDLIDGTYMLKAPLGRGGMGVVFACRHQILGNDYAIKLLSGEGLSEEHWSRFQLEAKALARLNHPGIVGIYNMGTDGGLYPYYVMDLLSGESLESLIKKSGPLPANQALSLFIQVADALSSAHAQGIIHRDIKPSNLMLLRDQNNQIDKIKIVDFGIARVTKHGMGQQSQTATGMIFGTPFYMSPEQCQGHRVDERSDIYSFGCALFEALTGSPPFQGDNAFHTFMMHQCDPPPSLRERAQQASFPQSLEIAVSRMLGKTPNERYQKMDQVKHDLERIKAGKEIMDRGLSGGVKFEKTGSNLNQQELLGNRGSGPARFDDTPANSAVTADFPSRPERGGQGLTGGQSKTRSDQGMTGGQGSTGGGQAMTRPGQGITSGGQGMTRSGQGTTGSTKHGPDFADKALGYAGEKAEVDTSGDTTAGQGFSRRTLLLILVPIILSGAAFIAVPMLTKPKVAPPTKRQEAVDLSDSLLSERGDNGTIGLTPVADLKRAGCSEEELAKLREYDFFKAAADREEVEHKIMPILRNGLQKNSKFVSADKTTVTFIPKLIIGALGWGGNAPVQATGIIKVPKGADLCFYQCCMLKKNADYLDLFRPDDLTGLQLLQRVPEQTIKKVKKWTRLKVLSFFNPILKALPGADEYDQSELSASDLKLLDDFNNLETLGLSGTTISGASVANMRLTHTLKSLRLKRVRDIEPLLRELPKLDNTNEIWLIQEDTTDDQLDYLIGMKNLKSLRIRRSLLTPKSLDKFKKMQALKELWLDRNWTPEEKAAFKKGIANCNFESVIDATYWESSTETSP